ncbi:gelsolin-like protein 2 [Ruditapes philippinarum]|uniref:gelsolin-like protein 2 n=1 Tax=Ruditapes philippinarum TaxID=129788 RepID=UPI00295B14D4|nr:gelsolin-like protein 2 [Ruditapes philippinarum]
MQKAKKYDWKDSNMALFGSDTEKQVKKESAESEPAWQGCGQEPGLQIWRIVKFQVTEWPKEDYSKFYEGDSYIVLNTYKKEDGDELLYDVHFWIGKHSTQDEYGTAAYKTVELDTFLDDKPIQHREVQGHESTLFKSYFESISYMKGGADTGFRRVVPEEYVPRLFEVKKEGRKIFSKEIARTRSNLKSDNVYIIDAGLTLYQWNGSSCSHDEKFKAAQEMQKIDSERGGKAKTVCLEEDSISPEHAVYGYLDGEDDDDDEPDADDDDAVVLKKVCDADGTCDLEDVKEGEVSRDDLTSDAAYLVHKDKHLFVWIGTEASVDERRNAFGYAHKYLQGTSVPWTPVTVVAEGKENDLFKSSVPGCA